MVRSIATVAFLVLVGCGGGAKSPADVDDDSAKAAFLRAKNNNDGDGLFTVYDRYRQSSYAKKALKLGAHILLDRAVKAAQNCDESTSEQAFTSVASKTSEDSEVDSAFNDAKGKAVGAHQTCAMRALESDVTKAESDGNYPKAFALLSASTNAPANDVAARRDLARTHYRNYIEGKLKEMVDAKSTNGPLAGKKAAFESSLDAQSFASELAEEAARYAKIYHVLQFVFETMTNAKLFDDPIHEWVQGTAKARSFAAPDGEVTEMKNASEFDALGQGKYKGTAYLLAGTANKDWLAQLASIALLVPDAKSALYDTHAWLPANLVGQKVFGPESKDSPWLVLSTVVSESPKHDFSIESTRKKDGKLTVSRADLRAIYLKSGISVRVINGNREQTGVVSEDASGDSVIVTLDDDTKTVPVSAIKVHRDAIPASPE